MRTSRTTRRPVTTAGRFLLAAVLVVSCRGAALGGGSSHDDSPYPRQRQPVALCVSNDGSRLFVANHRCGSIGVVDLGRERVVAEAGVGRSLADVAAHPDGRHLLALDREAGSLLLLRVQDDAIREADRLAVDPEPVSLAIAPYGGSCAVASLASRRLTFVDLADRTIPARPALAATGAIELPFPPHRMTWLRRSGRLIVAEAYGGRLAVIDPGRRVIESVRSLPAHNIQGLAESPDGRTLVVAHQVLRRLAHASFEDVHWGSFVGNQLHVLILDEWIAPDSTDPLRGSRCFELGEPGNGAGDPSAIAFDPEGRFLAALAGVDEIRIGADPGHLTTRAEVGRRPVALASSPDGRSAYVANMLDDCLSVVDVSTGRPRATISLGPIPERTPAERGERLFSDARLSHDGWMSCHSCHTDGHSNGRLADTLGDGGYGAAKRVPSLLGVGETGPWGWLGGFERLEDQVRQSIESTMQGAKPTEEMVSDLVAYLRDLSAPAPAIRPPDAASAVRGRDLFHARGCAECHAPPRYTTPQRYDVGLADEVGHRHFNPPSLRGVGRREPLLHDGRAATLDEVFGRHHHPTDVVLSAEEVADLLAFLRSL